jgi:large subunit ribosomal protein L10
MAISRERKEDLLAQYTDYLERSTGFIVTEYRGMKMTSFHEIRRVLREADASFVVTKNRLLKIALDNLGYAVPDELLNGPVAVGFAYSDLPGMVKALLDKKKEMELLVLKGGMIGQQVLGESDLDSISKLPTLDELRAQIAGMLVQPAQGLVNVLNAPPQNLVNVLNAGVGSLASVLAAYVAKQEAA